MKRRTFIQHLGGSLALATLLPAWARSATAGNMGVTMSGPQNVFNFVADRFPVTLAGHTAMAVGINGSLPGPLLRFREGDDITINVTTD
jgi:FtsP/CotA-like multicopper oxidase with cupredoxin domain